MKGSRYLLLENEANPTGDERLSTVYILIIAHARHPIHTGQLEGMHNKIKVIKRQAHGFRNDDYFILKIKGAFPGRLQPNPR